MKPINKLLQAIKIAIRRTRSVETALINQGRILSELHKLNNRIRFNENEFQVFSQWGEDGLIQFLIRNLDVSNETFIEFGVEDFSESNCRFLMMKDFWSGYIVDGAPENVKRIISSNFYWRSLLRAECAFVTRENVDELLLRSGFWPNPGILSIDIDGNDYHLFESLSNWRPSIYIFEYNSVFGLQPLTVPYDPAFVRSQKHYSNQYYGAGLAAFCYLADQRGYALVGCNKAGNNCFFVRRDLLNDVVVERPAEECFRDASFRESRDADGKLSFLTGNARRAAIGHLPVLNVVTNQQSLLSESV